MDGWIALVIGCSLLGLVLAGVPVVLCILAGAAIMAALAGL